MAIPGFSLVPPPEFVTAIEAVGMVMEQFKSSVCSEAEAVAWLTEQVCQAKLKLQWTGGDPEILSGLHLTRESLVYIPCFPGAKATDKLNWRTGELRRRLRYPKILDRWGGRDPLKMTQAERLARDEELRRQGRSEYDALRDLYFGAPASDAGEKCEERLTEELIYQFGIKRASLGAILDRASVPLGTLRVPLWEAGEIIANRFDVSHQMGLAAIADAAAAEQIEVCGRPQPEWQTHRIHTNVWRRIARGEAVLSPDVPFGEPLSGTCSDPYVFRGDLERLAGQMASHSVARKIGAKAGGRRSGRAAADFWQSAEEEAMRWLQDNGFPAPNDGNQAKLERHILDWLGARGYEVSEMTVRRHVRKCIARHRLKIGAEDQKSIK